MTNSNSKLMRHFSQLSEAERGEIQALLDAGITGITQIASIINRNKSTVSREIKRGSTLQRDSSYQLHKHYFADTAQIYHDKRRAKCYQRKPLKHYAVFLRMLARNIKAKFDATSIDEFVGEFKQEMPDYLCPSTPTVYRY